MSVGNGLWTTSITVPMIGLMPRPLLAARLRSRPVAFKKWRERPITAFQHQLGEWPLDEYAATVRAPSSGAWDPDAAFERVRDRILGLRLFPPQSIVLHADTPDGRAALEATIVQHFFFGPIALESAVRVVRLEDASEARTRRVSLTWATLRGHPERGIETFSASLAPEGEITITILARSRPGSIFVRLGSPLARRLQVRITGSSLRSLAAAAAGSGMER